MTEDLCGECRNTRWCVEIGYCPRSGLMLPRTVTLDDFVARHVGEPYTWGAVGPAGYDVRGLTEPTDWNAWIARDRVGALRALAVIELRYRLHLLRNELERRLVNVLARRR